jgi:uncharacterized protein YqgQ
MVTIYDVQQILKRFGTFIYTGDRLGDIELMTFEITELYQSGFLHVDEYQKSILLLRKEARQLHMKKDE